jgi:hypothetical protein
MKTELEMNSILSPSERDKWQRNLEKGDKRRETTEMKFLRSVIRTTLRDTM